jgi:hypothetical protein
VNKGFLCKKIGTTNYMDENIFKLNIALILLSALYDVVSVTKMVATIYYHFFIALRLGNDNIYGTVYKSGSKTIAYHSLTVFTFHSFLE